MTFTTQNAVLLACSVCGLPYTDDDGARILFTNQAEAVDEALRHGWLVSTAPVVYGPRVVPDFAVCDTAEGDRDHSEHQAARDLLLPVLDLVVTVDGQMPLPFDDTDAGGAS